MVIAVVAALVQLLGVVGVKLTPNGVTARQIDEAGGRTWAASCLTCLRAHPLVWLSAIIMLTTPTLVMTITASVGGGA